MKSINVHLSVHKDVTVKLERMDKILYEKVRCVLDINKSQRHIRGGIATRKKYSSLKSGKLKMESGKWKVENEKT